VHIKDLKVSKIEVQLLQWPFNSLVNFGQDIRLRNCILSERKWNSSCWTKRDWHRSKW